MCRIFSGSLCLIACLAVLSCQPAAPPTNLSESKSNTTAGETAKGASPADLEALSNRLVDQVAAVKEGES